MENHNYYIKLLRKVLIEEDGKIKEITDNFIEESIKTFAVEFKINPDHLTSENLEILKQINFKSNKNQPNTIFIGYIFYILLKIKEISKLEEILGTDDGQIVFTAYKIGIKFGVRQYLSDEFQTEIKNVSLDYDQLYSGILFYLNYFDWDILSTQTEGKTLILNIYYGIFTLKKLASSPNLSDNFLKAKDKIGINECFKITMFLNTLPRIQQSTRNLINSELLNLIKSQNGLLIFTELITGSFDTTKSDIPIWQMGEIIIKIVGAKGHPMEFYSNIFEQIKIFFNEEFKRQPDFIPIFNMILNKIYAFGNEILRKQIHDFLFGNLNKLAVPIDLLTGCIVLENDEFCQTITRLYNIFCISSTHAMRSILLVPYQHLLFDIYSRIPENLPQKLQINSIIIQCLSNRNSKELKEILENFIINKNIKGMKNLHPRVDFELINNEKLQFKIISNENIVNNDFNHEEFIWLLKISNHNILMYNIFMELLKILEENLKIEKINSPEFADINQLDELIFKNYNKKFKIISTISELINIKTFHSQFYENPREILEFIKKLIENELNNFSNGIEMILILSIFEILSPKIQNLDLYKEIKNLLKKLLKLNLDDELKIKINYLLNDELDGNHVDDSTPNDDNFNLALLLCKDKEPYMQGNGLNNLIKLINKKDEKTIANKHIILAVAIQILKRDHDSYTYLNCIKLLSTLATIFECEVIDGAIGEFKNEHNEIDFRLKMGEIIVKITEAIGPISIKYKNNLLDCFMIGAQNKIDELRTSSLSNLGTICRLLSYQIHSFFQELMNLIETIILNDKYLPSRRAAIMILSQLLQGIDNLIDFQEFLLPIYRALKYILSIETDESSILHAQIGLEILNKKVKEFLLPEDKKIEREIKIFGIKDNENERNLKIISKTEKPQIIELN